MKNLVMILASTAAVGLASSAFAANATAENKSSVEYKKNGGYEATATSEHTTAKGTAHEASEKVDVDVDSKGLRKETVKADSSTDPKGLLNAKKDTTKASYKDKDNGGYKQTKTDRHSDAAGTDTKVETTTDVDVDANNNATAVVKTEKTVDPKGLLNKKTTTNKAKAVNGVVVEQKKETN